MLEFLAEAIGESTFDSLNPSRRAQVLLRVFFGLLGTFLGVAGAFHFITSVKTANTAMHASMVALFIFIALFSLLNVTMKRAWRWPGLGIIVSFVALLVTRIAFGR